MILNESNADLRILDARLLGLDGNGLDAAHSWASGEVKISKNGGAFTNTANNPTAVASGLTGSFRLQIALAEVDTKGSLRVQFNPAGGYPAEYADVVIDALAGAAAVAAIPSAPSASVIAAAVIAVVIEGTETLGDQIRLITSVLAGPATGIGTASPSFYSKDGLVLRVAGTIAAGIRTILTRVGQ